MSEPILQVTDLKKYFEVSSGVLHAVDGVSFSINKGETLGVVGESGCGKSTLGRVILNLIPNTGGKIVYDGQDISHPSRAELTALRKKMQLIFQDPFSSLNPRMTVFQTLAEPLKIAKAVKSREELEKRVFDMMDTVGLARRLVNTYPHELDGGRRQRIGIGRALILTPQFIVCDEPVSALDVSIQAQVINLLLDIQAEMGLTYVFITHDLSVAKFIATNIIVMYLGKIAEYGPTKVFFERPLHPYSQALLSAVPEPDLDLQRERIHLKGEVTSPVNPKPGCRFAARCAYAKEKCFAEDPELVTIEAGHQVACHYVREINNL